MSVVEAPILKTKLVSQRSRSRLLDRPRLLSLLDVEGDVRPKLTVICGPAGYGKSTLVSQYIAAYPQLLSAWYSLDETDNNADVFARYLVAAYEEFGAGQELLNSDLKPRDQLAHLFNAIQQQHEPIQFVLDDFHWITNDRVLELFEWLLRSMPQQMSIVITTRETPVLDFMSELAVQGALREISAEQLKFTQPETEAFVSTGHDVSLDNQSLLTLYQKTEGWVAGLQLSMHALKKQTNVAEFIQRFSGSEKDIVGYLGSVVLGQKSQEVQDFFLSCSVLKRFNGDLCELVTRNSNAPFLLETLASEGLFIFELDRGWYRFHHLFGEFLLDRLREKYPGKQQELSSRVAAWFAEQGKAEQAIDYYLAAEEYETAIDLIAQQVSEVVQHRGHHDVLFRWLEKMPAQYFQRQPRVSICYAWSLIFSRHLDRVEEALSNIRQNHIPVSGGPRNSQESDWIQWNLGMLDAMFDLMYGRVLAAYRKTSDWLTRWPDAPEFEKGVVLGVHGFSCIHVLDLNAAKKAQREAKLALARCDSGYGVSWMSFLNGQILCLQGRVTEARHFLEDAFAVAQQQMGSRSVGAQLLKLGLGHISYITHDTERSRQYFEFSLESIAEHGSVDSILIAFLSQSNLQLQQGQKQASLDLLHKAETYGERLNLSHFQLSVVDQRIQRMLAEEKLEQARQLFSDHGLDQSESDSDRFTALESLQIALLKARFQLADGVSDEVIDSTASLMDFCGKHGLLIEYLRSGIIQARALYDSGQANKANRLLQKLLARASDNMLLSPFLEEQYYLAPLWPDFFKRYGISSEADAGRMDFVRRLTQSLNISELISSESEDESAVAQPLEALSAKEQEILRYLNQGLSNKELAETLFVSVSTIKWHLTHIYAKLGVKSRVEAIKVSQSLRL